jgi:hypothetical protein
VARRQVFDRPETELAIPASLKGKAVLALAMWVTAIIAGRLMAYFSGK